METMSFSGTPTKEYPWRVGWTDARGKVTLAGATFTTKEAAEAQIARWKSPELAILYTGWDFYITGEPEVAPKPAPKPEPAPRRYTVIQSDDLKPGQRRYYFLRRSDLGLLSDNQLDELCHTKDLGYTGPNEVAAVPVEPAKTKKVFYLAHPVSGDHVGNAFRAVEWVRWFSQNVPHLIVVAPWVAEVLAYPTKVPEGQVGSWDWALANDETVVRKLDGVITVGGRVSPGMQREVDACLANGGTYVDMSRFAIPGDVPEDFFIDEDI